MQKKNKKISPVIVVMREALYTRGALAYIPYYIIFGPCHLQLPKDFCHPHKNSKIEKEETKNHLSFTFNIKLKKKKNIFFWSRFLSLRICFCFFIFLLPTKTNCLFCVVKNYWNAAYTHKWRNFCYQMCLWNDTCKKLDSILPSTHIITNTNIILLINISVWAYYWANWVWFVCSTTELYPKTIQWNLVKTPPFPHIVPGPLPPSLQKEKKMTKPEWYFVFCLLRYK